MQARPYPCPRWDAGAASQVTASFSSEAVTPAILCSRNFNLDRIPAPRNQGQHHWLLAWHPLGYGAASIQLLRRSSQAASVACVRNGTSSALTGGRSCGPLSNSAVELYLAIPSRRGCAVAGLKRPPAAWICTRQTPGDELRKGDASVGRSADLCRAPALSALLVVSVGFILLLNSPALRRNRKTGWLGAVRHTLAIAMQAAAQRDPSQ